MAAKTVNVVVLFSGAGSNLEALIRRLHGRKIAEKEVRIVPIANRPKAGGIERARRYGVQSDVVDHTTFQSREAFDEALVRRIEVYEPALVVMAGFMRILTPVFTSRVDAINLHPSLLPLFKGADAIRRSFESGMKVGGVTVHRVTAELDSGEIVAQECVPIEESDTLESFTGKIRKLEHRLLPETVEKLLKDSATAVSPRKSECRETSARSGRRP